MDQKTVPVGNRMEMFVDDYLIDCKKRSFLRLNPPLRREIVLDMDRPWEGKGSGIYSVVFQDGDVYKMYYRATFPENENDLTEGQGCAYAESRDGIRWEKPKLGIVRYKGQDTNMVFTGPLAHNFSPFLDKNPLCKKDEKYKAVAGNYKTGLIGFCSEDGLRWRKIKEEPLFTKGAFDSHNTVFYDTNKNRYVCYSRYFDSGNQKDGPFKGVRAIQSNESSDFLNWSEPIPNSYNEDVPVEHLYTNAAVLCPGAEHIYLSFPMRFVPHRHKVKDHSKPGVSDNVIFSGRDGKHWFRPFLESWLKPGLDQKNWTQRSLIVAQGILKTGDEFSLFVNEHYYHDTARIRRVTVPLFRFASVYADRFGGTFLTKPFVLEGSRLVLNYATSAPGLVKVGLQDEEKRFFEGFSCSDCDDIYGDELEKTVTWNGSEDIGKLKGKVVRLFFELADADVYAFQIRP